MNPNIIRQQIMFAWIKPDELDFLMLLYELEARSEELQIETLAEGLGKLQEGYNLKEYRQCINSLLGLEEEGLIRIYPEQPDEDTPIDEIFITRRGKKLIDEAVSILYGKENEKSAVDEALQKQEKKAATLKNTIDVLKGFTTSFAASVLQKVFMP